jgi:hypothetical protein
MNGNTTFKCIFCEHMVTLLNFKNTNASRRTQAAVINQHAAAVHVRIPSPSKMGGRGAF